VTFKKISQRKFHRLHLSTTSLKLCAIAIPNVSKFEPDVHQWH